MVLSIWIQCIDRKSITYISLRDFCWAKSINIYCFDLILYVKIEKMKFVKTKEKLTYVDLVDDDVCNVFIRESDFCVSSFSWNLYAKKRAWLVSYSNWKRGFNWFVWLYDYGCSSSFQFFRLCSKYI